VRKKSNTEKAIDAVNSLTQTQAKALTRPLAAQVYVTDSMADDVGEKTHSRVEGLLEAFEIELSALSRKIETLHSNLRIFLPNSEFDDNGSCEKADDDGSYGTPIDGSPLEYSLTANLNEILRLNTRITYITRRVVV
jgi:hypothetical protein